MISDREKLDVILMRVSELAKETLPGAVLDGLWPGRWQNTINSSNGAGLLLVTNVPSSRRYLEIELQDFNGYRIWYRRLLREDAASQP